MDTNPYLTKPVKGAKVVYIQQQSGGVQFPREGIIRDVRPLPLSRQAREASVDPQRYWAITVYVAAHADPTLPDMTRVNTPCDPHAELGGTWHYEGQVLPKPEPEEVTAQQELRPTPQTKREKLLGIGPVHEGVAPEPPNRPADADQPATDDEIEGL